VTVQGKIQTNLPVGRMVGDMAALAKPIDQVFGGLNIVFYQ
jgi:hypothetical protein